MPQKHDPHATPAQKILGLFGLLLFSGEAFSLGRLAQILGCSKQTVLRMIEQIEMSHEAKIEAWIEGRERWFRVKAPKAKPNVSLSPGEIQRLVMCRDLVLHLLPQGFRKELKKTIAQTTVLLPNTEERSTALASMSQVEVKGAIDYTPFQRTIETFLEAIREKSVCEVVYQATYRPEPKTYAFAPLKIMAYRESLYVKGWLVREVGRPEQVEPRVFSVHRVKGLTATRRKFDFEDQEAGQPDYFGFKVDEPFRVKVKFEPESAMYVRERRWSGDQTIKELKNGKVVLEFTAQSRQEVVAWVLSFGDQAKVLAPEGIRKSVATQAGNVLEKYAKKT